ncbi:MAG: purine-nucleoside phosphorylase [Ignavibacteria bacterium]|nr:purine-nucleoside phosphorylase [Ignavibacteria bacterium]
MNNKIGIILGSGLNDFAKELIKSKIIFEDSSGFHNLKVLSGYINGKAIILFSGRKHFYEGYSSDEVFRNITLAKEFGVSLLIITNAAGGLNTRFKVSDIMLINSHFNFINKRFYLKKNLQNYEKDKILKIKNLAIKDKIILREGSYCSSIGPAYETKAEIRYLNNIGIDAVGMSTIPEILFANNFGIKTIGISCITNLLRENAFGITNHEEVIEAGKNSYRIFSKFLKTLISNSTDLI